MRSAAEDLKVCKAILEATSAAEHSAAAYDFEVIAQIALPNWIHRAVEAEKRLAEAQEVIKGREHEISLLRDLARSMESDRDLLDNYATQLDEIGRMIGCDHKEDGIVRCVRDALDPPTTLT